MFSSRIPLSLSPNRLAIARARLEREGRPIVDLTESNPTRAGFDYPDDLLTPLGHRRGLVYAPHPLGLGDARAAIARDFARRGIDVVPARLALTASTSEAYSALFKLLTSPGDEVLVPRPSYPLFDHLTRLDAVNVRGYDLEYHGRWSIDFASVEQAFTDRTRIVLVVNPNNPTGSFVMRGDMDRLAALCGDRARHGGAGVALVSDEVFADYEIEPGAAARAGWAADRHDVLAFALGGLSKSVGLPQVKLGWIAVAGPEAVVERAVEGLEFVCDTYLSVSTPVQAAAGELLARGAVIRDQIRRRTAANYAALVAAVSVNDALRVLPAEGGWYGVIQVPTVQPEEELVLELLEQDGVLAHPGYFFDFARESFLVVSLIVPETPFAAAIARIVRHFDCTTGDRARPLRTSP